MTYHTRESPRYAVTEAEVWFRNEADAERAGFTRATVAVPAPALPVDVNVPSPH